MSERYLGTTKYDSKVRRITLLKRIAEMLDVKEGDHIEYYQIDNEIIIRKQEKITADERTQLIKQINDRYKEINDMIKKLNS
jgi:hypothetical protein